jgi:hypothetical protein
VRLRRGGHTLAHGVLRAGTRTALLTTPHRLAAGRYVLSVSRAGHTTRDLLTLAGRG